jgi:hypothetical protein
LLLGGVGRIGTISVLGGVGSSGGRREAAAAIAMDACRSAVKRNRSMRRTQGTSKAGASARSETRETKQRIDGSMCNAVERLL